MLTHKQINFFHMVASCALGCMGEKLYDLEALCDPCAKPLFEKIELIQQWLVIIRDYKPDSPEITPSVLVSLDNDTAGDIFQLLVDGVPVMEPYVLLDDAPVDVANIQALLQSYSGFYLTFPFNSATVINAPIGSEALYAGSIVTANVTGTAVFEGGSLGQWYPAYVNDCLTYDEIITIMERVKIEIGFCGDLSTLPETDIIQCCVNSEPGQIVYNSLSFVCNLDGTGTVTANYTVTNGSGHYEFVTEYQGVEVIVPILPGMISGTNTITIQTGGGGPDEPVTIVQYIRDIYKGTISNSITIITERCHEDPPGETTIVLNNIEFECEADPSTNGLVTVNITVVAGSGDYVLQRWEGFNWVDIVTFSDAGSGTYDHIVSFVTGSNNYAYRVRDVTAGAESNSMNLNTTVCPYEEEIYINEVTQTCVEGQPVLHLVYQTENMSGVTQWQVETSPGVWEIVATFGSLPTGTGQTYERAFGDHPIAAYQFRLFDPVKNIYSDQFGLIMTPC